MSAGSHGSGERYQKVLRLHPLCHAALSPGDMCGSVAVQVHLPLPRRLQGTLLRDDAGRLQGGRGPELQLPVRHLHLLHGLTRWLRHSALVAHAEDIQMWRRRRREVEFVTACCFSLWRKDVKRDFFPMILFKDCYLHVTPREFRDCGTNTFDPEPLDRDRVIFILLHLRVSRFWPVPLLFLSISASRLM